MPKILIVDHHEKKRRWLSEILSAGGHEVICVPDGESGQKAFFEQKPAVCVLTMTLPRISGSELSLKLKSTPLGKSIPVILTSSVFKNMGLDKIAGSRWKVDAFLEEPYTKEQLLSVITAQMEAYASKSVPAAETAPEPESAEPVKAADEEIDPFGYVDQEDFDVLDAAMAAADIASEGVAQVEGERAAQRTTVAKDRRAPDKKKTAPSKAVATPKSPPEPKPVPAVEPDEGKKVTELSVDSEGELEDTSFPELAAALYFAGFTGVLSVNKQNVGKKVFYKNGCPLYVESDLREETLGQILQRHGLIDEETHFSSLKNMAEGDKRQGDALVDVGALTPTQLYKALKIQTREKLLSLFTWHQGHYLCEEKVIDLKELTTFEIWPPTLILQGILRYYDAASIREIVNEMKDFVLKAREDPPVSYADLRFPPEAERLFKLIDGRRTVSEVINAGPLPPAQTYQVFYALLVLEQMDKIDPGDMGVEEQEVLTETRISMDVLARATLGESKAESPHDDLIAAAADFSEGMLESESESFEFEEDVGTEALPAHAKSEIEPLTPLEAFASRKPAPPAKPTASERVSFSFDDEEGEEAPEEELRPVKEKTPALRPPAGRPAPPRKTESPALSDELNRTLDSFMEDVEEEEAGAPKEETVHLDLDDEGLTDEGGEALTMQGEDSADVSEMPLSEDDRVLLNTILSEYLALAKSSFYEILHIDPAADAKVVRDAYTALVKRFHPDRLQGRFSAEVLQKANDLMAKITDAYQTLSDFKRRSVYDQQLSTGGEKKERSVQMILTAENEFNMGLAAMKQHAWQEAKRHLLKAVEMFPEEGEYHACLGWSIYNLTDVALAERTKEARALMEKAIRLNPRSDKAYFYLGMLLKDNNMIEKAALMFAQSYRYNKNSVEAKNQLKAIQTLRATRSIAVHEKKSKSAKELLSTDISFNSVKKAILKIFW